MLLSDRIRLARYDSPPQTCDAMVLKPEVAWLDFISLCSNFEIISNEADFVKENLKGYSAIPKWF